MTVLSFIVIISLLVNLLDPVDKMGGSALEFVVFEELRLRAPGVDDFRA